MSLRILVTGSLGFIGTHVVDKLLALGHRVAGIDNVDEQVHGKRNTENIAWEDDRQSAFWKTDVGKLCTAFDRYDAVIHLAAAVGVGQSMHKISSYVDCNSRQTAAMLEMFLRTQSKPKRLIVASSMSVYGEGGTEPVREDRPVDLRSIYALTKYDQEQMCLIWGRAYKVPTVALRFFNTYGPGQSLNNPYTGVMAIFASRLLNGNPPVIYGTGLQARDFIHVDDVANAVVHAATKDIDSGVYNVGTGQGTCILDVARRLRNDLNPAVELNITHKDREGDIFRCVANPTKLLNTGWAPQIRFGTGLSEYCEWLLQQPKPIDRFDVAHKELVAHGLTD